MAAQPKPAQCDRMQSRDVVESVLGLPYFVQGGSGVLISDALPGLDVAPDPCHLAASDHV